MGVSYQYTRTVTTSSQQKWVYIFSKSFGKFPATPEYPQVERFSLSHHKLVTYLLVDSTPGAQIAPQES